MPKRVAILGSTGSIGTQTLDVIRNHPDKLEVKALIANRSAAQLKEQGQEWPQAKLALCDPKTESDLPKGMDVVIDLITSSEIDLVVVALAGVVGLIPTMAAIKAKKDIALASKEVLVAAGEVVMPAIKANGVNLTPIDSEHSAVFQCLQGYSSDQIQRIILTASGGPFRGQTRKDLEKVTVEQALNHPTWNMGGKITIDSATLMNKALETIEARWLFDTPMDKVEAVIHPQSIVHSFVEFTDGSALAQCGWPNMRLPIQYALLYPERPPSGLKPWNPVETPNLTFQPVDHETFPALNLAKAAVNKGGTAACAFNAANEEAVALFLSGKGTFLGIVEAVAETVARHQPVEATYDNILGADAWAREQVRRLYALD